MNSAREVGSQAPAGGLFQRLLGPFYVTGVFWYRLHYFGVSVLPRWAVAPVVLLFTSFFFLALRRIRRAIAANLSRVLGACGWLERQRRIFLTMWNLAWSLSERYERLNARRRPSQSVIGVEHWRDLLESGRGCVIVTAHIGNWETSLFDPRAVRDRHVHVVREEESDPRAQAFIRRLIGESAGDEVTVHFARADDTGLAMRLFTALRSGEMVAVQGDRPRAHARSVTARIFGCDLEVPSGPPALARAAGVPMLPAFSFRQGRLRTEIVFRPPIWVEKSGDREADLEAAARQLASNIEWAIRRRPFQWFCFRDLWGPDRTPSESGREAGPAGRSFRE